MGGKCDVEHQWVALRAAAVLVLIAALRSVIALIPDPSAKWDRIAALPATKINLATASWVELAWLPGIGAQTARSIVAQRPRLGAPLTLENLACLPGVGEATCDQIPVDWVIRMPTDSTSAQPPPK
jgi:hypothetical protein